jgi:RpiR family transcriptional regulator, carbohydrate utilization regulator
MLELTSASLDGLSPSEKRVGRLAAEKPRQFALMSTSQIASACMVSNPTVVRFCRSLGYDGIAQFKLKLLKDRDSGVSFVHASVEPNDSPANVALKILDNSIASLALFRSYVPKAAIERASDALAQAHHDQRGVAFYGSGHSGVVAGDAQLRFTRLGFSSVACCDGYSQVVNASARREGDVVVATSSSGRTKELLDAVDVARRRGASVIALTGTGTPLASLGSVHIATDHLEDFERFMPTSSRLLHLVVVDILATAVALKVGAEPLRYQLEQTQRLLRHRRYA